VESLRLEDRRQRRVNGGEVGLRPLGGELLGEMVLQVFLCLVLRLEAVRARLATTAMPTNTSSWSRLGKATASGVVAIVATS
jgi:hypothetical protein